jgi:homeobox protein cut-like
MPVNMVKAEQVNHSVPSSGGLDTTFVAKSVRELLAVHNIGQRLFAKHVLGLSQGTVSELLSKPKSWDKLTEKGRESYRKMHAWANDEANILALKSMSPKKSKYPIHFFLSLSLLALLCSLVNKLRKVSHTFISFSLSLSSSMLFGK